MANRSFRVNLIGATLLAAVMLAGAMLVVVVLTLARPAQANVPGENGKIAFVRYDLDARWDDPSSTRDIWVMNPDGSEKTNLTKTPNQGEHSPAVSPDGSRIAFVVCPEYECDVWVMNVDGSDRTLLADSEYISAPAWSPDGQKIAFVRDDDIWVINADGSEQTRLTKQADDPYAYPPNNIEPAWSPDGTKIAFASDRNNQCNPELGCWDYDIWVMNPDGSEQTDLTDQYVDSDGADERTPAWAPDSKHIAFEEGEGIFEMNIGSSRGEYGEYPRTNLTPETCDDVNIYICSNTSYVAHPAYSPDGKKLVYQRGVRGDIFVMNRDGSGKTNLTEDPTLESYEPDWGPVPPPDDEDLTKPTITHLKPAPGAKTPDRTPTVKAKVSDETSELSKADIKLYINGRRIGFSYVPKTDRLSRTMGRLSLGKHTVKIVATDEAANTATKRWSFKVVRRR